MSYVQLANKLHAAGDKAQYDACAKNLLSEKIILAWIFKYCTDEFKNYDISRIVQCIEKPQVSETPVHQNTSKQIGDQSISGLNTEDKPIDEAKVLYDILFHAWVPDSKQPVRLWINLEAQKTATSGYSLLKRGIYYCGRLLSQQFGKNVEEIGYDNIEKVYSIWICESNTGKRTNTINKYTIAEESVLGNFRDKQENYDLLTVVMVGLDTNHQHINVGSEKSDNEKLIGMLSTLLSSVKKSNEKLNILEQTYNIHTSDKFKQEVSVMCNLSHNIEARGEQNGIQLANARNLSALMKNANLSLIEAMKMLGIDQSEYELYKEFIEQMQSKNNN